MLGIRNIISLHIFFCHITEVAGWCGVDDDVFHFVILFAIYLVVFILTYSLLTRQLPSYNIIAMQFLAATICRYTKMAMMTKVNFWHLAYLSNIRELTYAKVLIK